MTWVHISILSLLLAMWAVFWMVRNMGTDLKDRIDHIEGQIWILRKLLSELDGRTKKTKQGSLTTGSPVEEVSGSKG